MSCGCTYECECQNICGKGRRRGATGATGPTGPTGDTGATGATGNAAPGYLKFSGVLTTFDAYLADSGNSQATLPAGQSVFVYHFPAAISLTSITFDIRGLDPAGFGTISLVDALGNQLSNYNFSSNGAVTQLVLPNSTFTVGVHVVLGGPAPLPGVNIRVIVGFQ